MKAPNITADTTFNTVNKLHVETKVCFRGAHESILNWSSGCGVVRFSPNDSALGFAGDTYAAFCQPE
jgi:hypothetical protein